MSEPAFKKWKIEWIPVRNLSVIWVQAQRPFIPKKSKDIADNFDRDMFGTLAVTMPNGQGIYHIIEGQHRRNAVEMRYGQDEQVPCEVINAIDPARAAQLFDGINNRRNQVQPIATFRVRLTAGYLTEIEVDKIVRAAGYRIESSREERTIACVNTLIAIYTRCGAQILADTLKVIQSMWGMDPNAVTGAIVTGFALFLLRYGGKANWQHIKDVMLKRYTSPGRLLSVAKTNAQENGGTVSEHICELVLANYNRGYKKPLS